MRGHNRLSKALYASSFWLIVATITAGVVQYPDITKLPFYLSVFGLSSLMFGQYVVIMNLKQELAESDRSWSNFSKR
jgi:hypothetical protein